MTFGKDMYDVEHKSGGANLPKKLVIGVDGSGIDFIDSTRTKLVQHTSFDRCEQWGASEKLIVFMIKSPAGTSKYEFVTKQGQAICELITEITVAEEQQ